MKSAAKFPFWGIAFLFVALCFVLGALGGPLHASAAGASDVEEDLREEVERSMDDLISEELEEFYRGLEDAQQAGFGENVRQIVRAILNGEQPLNVDAVFALLFGAVREQIFALALSMTTAIGLSILMGVAKNLNSGFSAEGSSKIIYFAVYAAIIATACIQLNHAIMVTKTMASRIKRLSELLFPVLITVMSAIGATSGASAFHPLTMVVSALVSGLIEGVVLPLFYASVVFAVVGNLSEHVRLNRLSSAMNSLAKWVLGSVFGIIMTIIGIQGVVGASVDGVGIRSARFALQSYVPVLGGYLSEGFDVVLASCILLKNAVGLTGVVLLLLIMLSPAVTLIVTTLSFQLTAGILEPMGDPKIAAFYAALAKSMKILIGIVLGLGFLMFLAFYLIIQSCNMGVA